MLRTRSVVPFVIAVALSPLSAVSADLLEITYTGFTVTIDCNRRGAVRFEYLAKADGGSLPRKSSFTFDRDVEDRCQQTATKSYGSQYDRGQLVPANHLDHSRAAIAESNNITNILPQARNMNRGAWLLTEEIIECHRDVGDLRVIGGVIWGHNPHDDDFVESHGVETPDYFWKVIIKQADKDAIAWMVPNSSEAKRRQLDLYLIRIDELEELVGETFDVSNEARSLVRDRSWPLTDNCDRS